MITSGAFNYVNVLGAAADGAWARNSAISNNISNIDTPNYKRQDVSFQWELQQALRNSKYPSLDQKVNNVNKNNSLSHFSPRTYLDHAGYSYRLDGNNVDIDTENVELASNQLLYNGIIQSIDNQFKNYKAVIK